MGKEYFVDVNVATLWTTPDAPRALDQDAIGRPAKVKSWLMKMSDDDRLALCDQNLVQSQVLFGEKVTVIEERGNWAKVAVPSQPTAKDSRGYPGWIPLKQLSLVNSEEKSRTVMIQAPLAILYDGSKMPVMLLSFATKLPYLQSEGDWVLVDTPSGSKWLQKKDVGFVTTEVVNGEAILNKASAFIGLPYLWGGMSGFGFDCSGFCHTVFRSFGIPIPRDASEQSTAGKRIEISQAACGDLLYFANAKGFVHHVGICAGEGKMLHAPKTGKTIECIDLKGTIYEEELCEVRRFHG